MDIKEYLKEAKAAVIELNDKEKELKALKNKEDSYRKSLSDLEKKQSDCIEKTIKESIPEEYIAKIETKKIGNNEWTVYNDQGENHIYCLSYENDTYVISYHSNDNIEKFEQEFIKNISISINE